MIIFAHIPKTGGTAFIKYVSAKLKPEEVLILDYKKLRIDPDSGKIYDYKKVVDKYLSNLSQEEKDKIKFLTGHVVPYGVHEHFSQKAKYMTFLREPVKRTVSLFNYFVMQFLHENFWNTLFTKQIYHDILLIDAMVPPFDRWVEFKFGDISRPFSLGTQSDYFKVLEYRLDKFDFVGLTQDLASLDFANVSDRYLKKITREARGAMRPKLRRDYLLYNRVNGIQKRRNFRYFVGRGLKGE